MGCLRRISFLLPFCFLFSVVAGSAQLQPEPSDPLARIRDAAKNNVQGCSATGETLCEQVAPKIIANAEGDSPLAENLRRVRQALAGGMTHSVAEERAVAWSVTAFQDAGADVHTEKYANVNETPPELENVVAEIRGREKPDEWVLVGAHLDTWANGPGVGDYNCDAAMAIEAARAILQTQVRPRRSIRFVLFTGNETAIPGSWAYVRSHRDELDRVRAAILFHTGCSRMTGYSLNARNEIESGLREAMKPIEKLGADRLILTAWIRSDSFDFLLEGIPTLTADHIPISYVLDASPAGIAPEQINIADLKHNIAVVAVTAFDIAERAKPIGPRQSRSQIESLLESSGLRMSMKQTSLWSLWESGQRGRLP